jgi:hypothetical protein
MNVEVGDRIPNAVLKHMGSDGPLDVRENSTEDLCNGKKSSYLDYRVRTRLSVQLNTCRVPSNNPGY